MSESLKDYINANLFRGCYETAEETPVESPLQFFLFLAHQQQLRNERTALAHDAVAGAVAEP